MARVFISYHHARDQWYKDELIRLNSLYGWFDDFSVNSGEIDDEGMTDEAIRVKVRDEYLRGSTVTIVLVGLETRLRKHVDWEFYSSMRDSPLNKQSGVILVPLPETNMTMGVVGHGDLEKKALYPEVTSWVSSSRGEYESQYPYFSRRMIDNLVSTGSLMSVIPWTRLMSDVNRISTAINISHNDRGSAQYDLSTQMRRRNG